MLRLRFAALDFAAPELNRFAYRLDGFDADWVEAGTQPDATYTNLDPGRYVFRARATNHDGVWSQTELRVPLLFHLRRDPFEKAQHNSNTYNDWFLDRPFVIVPLQQLAGKFLMSLKEYPPSQTPGSFNLEKIQKMIADSAGG